MKNRLQIIKQAKDIRELLYLKSNKVSLKSVCNLIKTLKINIYYYSDYINNKIDTYENLVKTYGNDGCTVKTNTSTFIILNDLTDITHQKHFSKHRILFTLIHELGHVILNHLDNYVDLSDYEYREVEKEADFFAINILLPESVLHNFIDTFYKDGIIDSNELAHIASYFNVSWTCLINRLDYLNIQKKQLSMFLINTYDSRKEYSKLLFTDLNIVTKHYIDQFFYKQGVI